MALVSFNFNEPVVNQRGLFADFWQRALASLLNLLSLPVISSTYTPILVHVANVTAATAYECVFTRCGSMVIVSGRVDVDPAGAGAVELGLSLPIPSTFSANGDAGGAAFSPSVAGFGAAILADPANGRVRLQWIAVDTAAQSLYFTFSYRIR